MEAAGNVSFRVGVPLGFLRGGGGGCRNTPVVLTCALRCFSRNLSNLFIQFTCRYICTEVEFKDQGSNSSCPA